MFSKPEKGQAGDSSRVNFFLTFVKPGVDVYRVITKQKIALNALVNPASEMVLCKRFELFAECIPGALIQAMAFVSNGEHSAISILSLTSSILTAAFISTSIRR